MPIADEQPREREGERARSAAAAGDSSRRARLPWPGCPRSAAYLDSTSPCSGEEDRSFEGDQSDGRE